jgi:hypothetical protein
MTTLAAAASASSGIFSMTSRPTVRAPLIRRSGQTSRRSRTNGSVTIVCFASNPSANGSRTRM